MARNKSETTVYHHTSKAGARAILKSGRIKQSDNRKGDARYGKGTYVTRMGPQRSKDKIAQNNYDGATNYWEQQKDKGKTDVALEIKMSKHRVTSINATRRDIHKVKGDILARYIHKIHVRKDGEVSL
ncbi:uncharacterized protein LOC134695219 [Mytilus trossulus]|uniref:uncharacterized protein LOC134695219 n=1 Tax=Mytilus trossulus TaxID=6551 RepID=UPI003005E25F